MERTIKLHWTSMNEPINNKAHYWELGTIINFKVKPSSNDTNGTFARKIFISDNKLEPETELVVTEIKDLGEQSSNMPRFQITLYKIIDGSIEGEPLKIGYRSTLCHQACWRRKVDSYTVKITEPTESIYGNEHGNVSTYQNDI